MPIWLHPSASQAKVLTSLALLQITVAQLKSQLAEKTSIPAERQRIIYQGRALENEQKLQACGECAQP